MTEKEEFIGIYTEKIKREGADKLLDFLENKSDFFTAPASTRYHNAFEGGLLRHSLNVYKCLCAYMERDRVKTEYGLSASDESIAIAALLHAALRSRRKKRLHDKRIYAAYPRGGYGYTLAHGLFGNRGQKHRRQSAGDVSLCFCAFSGGYGGELFP